MSKVLQNAFPNVDFQRHFSGMSSNSSDMPKPERKANLAARYETNKLIERIGYWVPPDERGYQHACTPRTNLKIAAVVEERLYQGLRYEAHMMLLTPNNWKSIIRYGRPDFLLMESIWTTATGHWHIAQCPPTSERNQLLEMVSYSRQQEIPTVFWFTKNHVYHELYKTFARHFDYVFCADPIEAEKLRNEGVNAELLLPCAHQANNANNENRNIPILFDGWADLDKYTADLDPLKNLKTLGLKIIESRYQIFKRRLSTLPEYKEQIAGCVTRQGLYAALKSTQCYITFEKTLSTITTQQWMSLEAIGLGATVFHAGEMDVNDPRYSIVHNVKNIDQLYKLVKLPRRHDHSFLIDKQLTFADRLSQIINTARHKEHT